MKSVSIQYMAVLRNLIVSNVDLIEKMREWRNVENCDRVLKRGLVNDNIDGGNPKEEEKEAQAVKIDD